MSDAALSPPERILIIQRRKIGDVVLATPLLGALRRRYPESRIDFYVEPWCAAVLEDNPQVDGILIAGTFREDVLQVRAGRYDLILDPRFDNRTAALCRLSRARCTISFAGRPRSRLYTHTPLARQGLYSSLEKLALTRPLGFEAELTAPEVRVPESACDEVAAALAGRVDPGAPMVCVAMAHTDHWRRWPAGLFVLLARHLSRDLGATCVFAHAPAEAAYVQRALDREEDRHLLGASLTLKGLAALQWMADLHVGNCSSPRHMAVAVGASSLTVHGSTDPGAFTFPDARHGFVMPTWDGWRTTIDQPSPQWHAGITSIPLEPVEERATALLAQALESNDARTRRARREATLAGSRPRH